MFLANELTDYFNGTVRCTQMSVDSKMKSERCQALVIGALQQAGIGFGTFDCREHFSLAMALHLAIMSGQLGNVWDTGFHKLSETTVSHSELG